MSQKIFIVGKELCQVNYFFTILDRAWPWRISDLDLTCGQIFWGYMVVSQISFNDSYLYKYSNMVSLEHWSKQNNRYNTEMRNNRENGWFREVIELKMNNVLNVGYKRLWHVNSTNKKFFIVSCIYKKYLFFGAFYVTLKHWLKVESIQTLEIFSKL